MVNPGKAKPEASDYVFEIGQRLRCEWREGDLRDCEVIERRTSGDGAAQYYVHYVEFNRRLDEWVAPERLSLSEHKNPAGSNGDRKRKLDAATSVIAVNTHDATAGELDPATQREHEAATRVKNIHKIVLGRWEMQTWYYSPFPKGYADCDTLYFCEFDLHFVKRREALARYMKRCDTVHPPGDEIYRSNSISVFEIDGAASRTYCQNLCLLAKLFLDHKTLYYDVDPFLFYVLCEVGDDGGHRIAGYFSKEKFSSESNNIACILVLPQHQRKGYGKLIIDVSYQITIREGKVGSPEKPLSDLGQLSFRSYWTAVLLHTLSEHRGNLSIRDISLMTAIKTEDIISTLQSLNLIKYWKGQHVISVSPKIVDEHLARNARPSLRCETDKLRWQPAPDENQSNSSAG